jgi:hypothetical protein
VDWLTFNGCNIETGTDSYCLAIPSSGLNKAEPVSGKVI